MAAKIPVSAEFEERMWVYTISAGDNIEGHDKVSDKFCVRDSAVSEQIDVRDRRGECIQESAL